MAEGLGRAQELYNEGKWAEALGIIDKNLKFLTTDAEIAEANRIKGWSYYYLGIKGSAEKKVENLQKSKDVFQAALEKGSEEKIRISVMNGLPLTLWILGQNDNAWDVSDQAVQEFPDIPSIWNTRSILCRWVRNFKESVKVCEKVYQTALAKGDYRTAGHGKHNRADALKELGKIKKARREYNKAIELYKKFEKATGQSAKFHIEGVEKKIANL